MPRSKGRKAQRKREPPPLRRPIGQSSLTKRFLQWLLATPLHQIEIGVSLIVGIGVIFGWIYDALHEPEIHAHSGVIQHPFELHFSLHNPSLIFSMRDMHFTCIAKEIELGGPGSRFSDTPLSQSGLSATLSAGRTVEYACPFDRFFSFPTQPIIRAQIMIVVDFKTLWFKRATVSEQFMWTAQSQQWIEGEIIN